MPRGHKRGLSVASMDSMFDDGKTPNKKDDSKMKVLIKDKICAVVETLQSIENDSMRELLVSLVEPLLSMPLEKRHCWADEAVDWVGEALKTLEADAGKIVTDFHEQLGTKKLQIKELEQRNSTLATQIVRAQQTVARRQMTQANFMAELEAAETALAEKKSIFAEEEKKLLGAKNQLDTVISQCEEFQDFKLSCNGLSFWTKKYKNTLDQSLREALEAVFSKKDVTSRTQFDIMAIDSLDQKLQCDRGKAEAEVKLCEEAVAHLSNFEEAEMLAEHCKSNHEAVTKKLQLANTHLEETNEEKEDVQQKIDIRKDELAELKLDLSLAESKFDTIYSAMGAFRYLQSRTDVTICPPTNWTPFLKRGSAAAAGDHSPKRNKNVMVDDPFGRRVVLKADDFGLTPQKSMMEANSFLDNEVATPYPKFEYKPKTMDSEEVVGVEKMEDELDQVVGVAEGEEEVVQMEEVPVVQVVEEVPVPVACNKEEEVVVNMVEEVEQQEVLVVDQQQEVLVVDPQQEVLVDQQQEVLVVDQQQEVFVEEEPEVVVPKKQAEEGRKVPSPTVQEQNYIQANPFNVEPQQEDYREVGQDSYEHGQEFQQNQQQENQQNQQQNQQYQQNQQQEYNNQHYYGTEWGQQYYGGGSW